MLPPGYKLSPGSHRDGALLLKFMYLTYQELFPDRKDFSHLAATVEQYLSRDTLLWWVELAQAPASRLDKVACLWMGNAIDQGRGDRYGQIFLLYVNPDHRRRGIGKGLTISAQNWALKRGDRQIGLQVFSNNQPAIDLYHSLGFQTLSLLMIKPLGQGNRE